MLINLSNHPVVNWEASQIKSAELSFGSIVDLSFPAIPPEADSDIILKLADTYLKKCLDLLNNNRDEVNAVHIMGEMTFSFAIVNKLIKENIICLASTTERNTSLVDDKKISKFKFVRFRKYSF